MQTPALIRAPCQKLVKEPGIRGHFPLKWRGVSLGRKFPEEVVLEQITVQEEASKRWEEVPFDFPGCVFGLRPDNVLCTY